MTMWRVAAARVASLASLSDLVPRSLGVVRSKVKYEGSEYLGRTGTCLFSPLSLLCPLRLGSVNSEMSRRRCCTGGERRHALGCLLTLTVSGT